MMTLTIDPRLQSLSALEEVKDLVPRHFNVKRMVSSAIGKHLHGVSTHLLWSRGSEVVSLWDKLVEANLVGLEATRG